MDPKEKELTKKILVPIADGSEEIEAACIIDTLRRSGAEVTVASIEPGRKEVVCSRKMKIVADCLLSECKDNSYDMIVLPGGSQGAERLRDCEDLITMLLQQRSLGKYYAAICAAPAVVLEPHGLLAERKATCYPTYVEKLKDPELAEQRVVVSKNCVTSRAPGTALEFALKLVELLYNRETAEKIQKAMLVPSF